MRSVRTSPSCLIASILLTALVTFSLPGPLAWTAPAPKKKPPIVKPDPRRPSILGYGVTTWGTSEWTSIHYANGCTIQWTEAPSFHDVTIPYIWIAKWEVQGDVLAYFTSEFSPIGALGYDYRFTLKKGKWEGGSFGSDTGFSWKRLEVPKPVIKSDGRVVNSPP